MCGPCTHTQEVYKPPQISSKHRGIPLLNTKVAWQYSCNNSCYFKGFFVLCNTTSSSKICGASWLPTLLPITRLQPVATSLWPVEKFPVRCMDRDWKQLKTHRNCQPGPISVFSGPGPGPVLVFFRSYGLDFQSLVMGNPWVTVSSIKHTTHCLCYMHWLSFISLTFIGILPIVHSSYFSYFCTAEALWTFMDSLQLYSHLVRLRSAA